MKWLFERHEPHHAGLAGAVKAGIGACVAISVIAWMAMESGLPFLIAPLGATAFLLFAVPMSPLSQPVNILGGYAIAIVATELAMAANLPGWTAAAIGIGVAVTIMILARLSHPPAGALTIFAALSPIPPLRLVEGVAGGAIVLILIATAVHAIPPRQVYPRRSASG